jgi:hypothetical protein
MTTKLNTPWGMADSVEKLNAGILRVGTPGHGGLFVPHELIAKMPRALAESNSYSGPGSNWFEEDCEWALPVIAFPELFDARDCYYAVRTVGHDTKLGEYFYSASQWLVSDAGKPARDKAATWVA